MEQRAPGLADDPGTLAGSLSLLPTGRPILETGAPTDPTEQGAVLDGVVRDDAVLDGAARDLFSREGGSPPTGRDNARKPPLVMPALTFRRLLLLPYEGPTAVVREVATVSVTRFEVLRFDSVNQFLHPVALATVRMEFGPVSLEQFEILHAEFGGRSRVPYDSSRSYEVIDFLPPAIQALVDVDIEPPPSVDLPGTDEERFELLLPLGREKNVAQTANCHGTALLAMRAFQGEEEIAPIFIGDGYRMDMLTEGPRFERIADLEPEAIETFDARTLSPGDVVQFFRKSEYRAPFDLLHSSVYVGGGLFFDDPNTEIDREDSPYRLATFDMVRRPVEHYLDGAPMCVRISRTKERLPEPEVIFETSFKEELAEYAQTMGKELGSLVGVTEYRMGGGTMGEALASLLRYPIQISENGRGSLVPVAISATRT